MDDNLLIVSLSAFGTVILLLSLLALLMRLLIWLFPESPEPEEKIDPAVVSAIATAAATALPGARVTRIKESTR